MTLKVDNLAFIQISTHFHFGSFVDDCGISCVFLDLVMSFLKLGVELTQSFLELVNYLVSFLVTTELVFYPREGYFFTDAEKKYYDIS